MSLTSRCEVLAFVLYPVPHYAVYTPYRGAVVHRTYPRDFALPSDDALCGFRARLGWFATSTTPEGLGRQGKRLCARCERIYARRSR